MKPLKTAWPVILACTLLLSSAPGQVRPARPAAAPSAPLALVRIPKTPALPLAALARLGLDVRQELGTCLLALADGDDQAMMRRSGVRFAVLDRAAAGRDYVLVETRRPGALASLRAAGRAVAVEAGTAVFWTDDGDAAAAVPAGLARKAWPACSVLPHLRSGPPAATPAAVAAAVQDPVIDAIVANISPSNLAARVQTLQDFGTRYASTTNCEAAGEALFAAFAGLGLDDVHFESFPFSSYTSRNVVAEKTGETFPDDVYIICSHYDSTSPSSTRLTDAPGADDNASGTAAVLEAARVLADVPLDYTVRFVAFSAEEWGLYGSRAYAAAARGAGEAIRGVLNLDMIGYADAAPEDLQVFVNQDSAWLADLFVAAGPRYGPVTAVKVVDPSIIYSDHSPFWDNGYAAFMAIEDYPLANPYYHRTTDTLATLDQAFFAACARASVGLLAELAQPIKAGHPRTPARLEADWDSYSSLFTTLAVVNLAWPAQADAAGYNVYRTSFPHLGYVKINGEPVTGTHFADNTAIPGGEYYYALTAVGPTGLESNRSRDNTWSVPPASPAAAPASALRGITPLLLRGSR